MMLHNSPPLHELPQGFSCVRQVLYRKRFPAPDQVPAQIEKTTRKARQTRGSVGVRELALKEPPLPSFHRFHTRRLWNAHRTNTDLAGVISVPKRRRLQRCDRSWPLVLLQSADPKSSARHLEHQRRHGVPLPAEVLPGFALL